MRYTTKFSGPNTNCFWMADNPGFTPVIDSDQVCIALVDSKELAERIAASLNFSEAYKEMVKI